MKLGFIGAGFVARFQAVAVHQVRGLEIDAATLAELETYVPAIQQGKGAKQLL